MANSAASAGRPATEARLTGPVIGGTHGYPQTAAGVDLTVVTRDEEHCLSLIAAIEAKGFPVERIR